MNNSVRGYVYALIAVVIFAFFEWAIKGLLHSLSVPTYTLIRAVATIVLLAPFALIDRNARARLISFDKQSLVLHGARGICWMLSIYFLGMSLFLYKSQALAYGMFLLHPVYTMACGWLIAHSAEGVYRWYPSFSLRPLGPIFVMILGAFIFGFTGVNDPSESKSGFGVLLFSPFLAGLFFSTLKLYERLY